MNGGQRREVERNIRKLKHPHKIEHRFKNNFPMDNQLIQLFKREVLVAFLPSRVYCTASSNRFVPVLVSGAAPNCTIYQKVPTSS